MPMATQTLTITTDDLDGSENAATYYVVNPADGKTYAIDLGPKNYDKLVKALAFVLDSGKATQVVSPTKATTSGKVSKVTTTTRANNTPDYDRAAFKAWAEANGKWTGKRPKLDDIKTFLEQAA